MRWLILFLLFPFTLAAQERKPSHCIALVDVPGMTFVHKAKFADPLEEHSVRLNYIDHATFILETAGGLSVATDYTGFLGVRDFVPTAVTMNRAHSSHWTARPDPRIPRVLRGWNPDGRSAADHHLDLGEMLIRNVATDIRGRFSGEVDRLGNSIFVFEVGGLCIGHLGHLHHEPDAAQYAALGRLDVVMAPVDGGMTLDLPTMIKVLKRLRSSVVIPMHWFSSLSLDQFLAGMEDEFEIDRTPTSFLEVSLRSLPSRPTVKVLRPAYLRDDGDE